MVRDVYTLTKSSRQDKKFMVITPANKKIHFGAAGMSDFTLHKDEKRKENYAARHSATENWNDLNTAGAWAYWILWTKPTLVGAIKNMENKFKIRIAVQ